LATLQSIEEQDHLADMNLDLGSKERPRPDLAAVRVKRGDDVERDLAPRMVSPRKQMPQ